MSGGGSSGDKKKKDEPAAPAQATYNQPAFMPGMDSMLAQQLSMGGYGDPSSLLAAFGPIFSPMQVPDYRPGATPAPTPTTPTKPNNRNPLNMSPWDRKTKNLAPYLRGDEG